MTKRKAEIVFLLLLLVVSIAVFAGSLNVRIFTSEPLTARTYGCAVSVLLAATVLVQLLKDAKALRAGQQDAAITIKEPVRVGLAVAATVAYCFGISSVGFYSTTYVFTVAMLVLLTDRRDPAHIAGYLVGGVAFCVFLYWLFQMMQVYLPHTPFI